MKIPKTPKEFDYDLWTTEEGKYMVRVKATGEVTEVGREVMKALRAEEKRMRRSFAAESLDDEQVEGGNTVLSLDALPDDDVKSAAWLADPHSFTEELTMRMLIENFVLTLTEKQSEVFRSCVISGESLSSCAKRMGVDYTTVKEARNAVRKKFKNFFDGTP